MAVANSSSAIDDRLRSLETKIQRIEDREAIATTLTQYAYALDTKDVELWSDVFTEDGVWRTVTVGKYAGTAGMHVEGRAALREWIQRMIARDTPDHPRLNKHVVTAPTIQLHGDEATAQAYFTVVHATENGPLLFAAGRYQDTVVRCADGRWRIKDRLLARESVDKHAQSSPVGGAP